MTNSVSWLIQFHRPNSINIHREYRIRSCIWKAWSPTLHIHITLIIHDNRNRWKMNQRMATTQSFLGLVQYYVCASERINFPFFLSYLPHQFFFVTISLPLESLNIISTPFVSFVRGPRYFICLPLGSALEKKRHEPARPCINPSLYPVDITKQNSSSPLRWKIARAQKSRVKKNRIKRETANGINKCDCSLSWIKSSTSFLYVS